MDMAPKLERLIDAIVHFIPLETIELPGEFFPAHLPVAVMDAVFRTRGRYGPSSVPAAERYCRKFGLASTREDRWNPPPVDQQETLGDLVRRHDELGPDKMTTEVFELRCSFPKHQARTVGSVLHVARALQSIGVDVLQDVSTRHINEISETLQCLPGIGQHTVRRLLMYTGGDDFVLGDAHIRRFVANAVGRTTISSHAAEQLVRNAAYELILSPRFLDCEIWRYRLTH